MADNAFADLVPQQNAFADLVPEKRTKSEEMLRQLGLAARYGIEGVGSVVNIAANPLAYGVNQAMSAADIDFRFPEQNQALSGALTEIGLPEPETRGEEVVGNISRAVAGGGGIIKAAQLTAAATKAVPAAVSSMVAEAPGTQLAAATSGSASAEMARAGGAGPAGQTAAALAGGMTPSALRYSAATGARGAVRGGEAGRQAVESNVDQFARAGTTPSVAQATEGRAAQAAENLLAKTPGAAGRMSKFAEQQADDVATNIERKAQALAGKTTGEQAGRTIQKKIKGGFVPQFRARQSQLYDELDNFIAPDATVSVRNTVRELDNMTRPIAGAEKTSGRLVNKRLSDIAQDIAEDAGGQMPAADGSPQLPFAALKELRTVVGEKLSTVNLADDVSKAEWKRLYGALSEDMKTAADITPAAKQAWTRANRYTRAGHERIDYLDSVIRKKGGPEKIFKAATSGTKEGATVLRSVMQSLDREGQQIVTATVLRRLGHARPGSQNAAGDVFSAETFLTNWSALSKEAKRVLFDRHGASFRRDMDAVASYAANLRQGAQVFRNPSGTAQAGIQYTTTGAFLMSLITGNIEAAGAIVAGTTGANRMAALMTRPDFVRWLARTTQMPADALPAAMNMLAQQSRGDTDLAWFGALVDETYQGKEGETDGTEQP